MNDFERNVQRFIGGMLFAIGMLIGKIVIAVWP